MASNRWSQGAPYGTSAIPYVGKNGNWWVNQEDTGVKAQGEVGPQGPKGDAGIGAPGPALKYEDMTEEQKQELSSHYTPEMLAIKDDTIAEAAALKEQTIAEVNAIKEATVEDSRTVASEVTTEIMDKAIADAQAEIDAAVKENADNISTAVTNAENAMVRAEASANSAAESAVTALTAELNADKARGNAQAYANNAIQYMNTSKTNADIAVENATASEQYRDEAERAAARAFSSTPEGYAALVQNVSDNTEKLDTLIEEAELNIQNSVVGESIHLVDSTDDGMLAFGLRGKVEQKQYSGKNLLQLLDKTKSSNGINFTTKDGVITANGTATDTAKYGDVSEKVYLKAGNYIFNGCPSGGSTSTYRLIFAIKNADESYVEDVSDTGNGRTFTITQEQVEAGVFGCLLVRVYSGQSASNLTFYPMIRKASITDATYEPYVGGTPSPSPDYPQDIGVVGASYNLFKNTATSQPKSGVTFTVNNDGSVTANGTVSGEYAVLTLGTITLSAGTEYIISGCPNGGSDATYRFGLTYVGYDLGKSMTYLCTADLETSPFIRIEGGVTVNNLTFYPMIRKASVKNDRYMPYGKGSVEVVSVGKNYSDLSKVVSASSKAIIEKNNNSMRIYNTVEGTYVTSREDIDSSRLSVGKKYTVSADVSYTKGQARLTLRNSADSSILAGTSYITTSGKYSFTFEFTGVECYLSLFATGGTSELGDVTYSNVQLEEGSVATEHQPYTETTATISTPDGTAGINGVYDEVVKYADGSGKRIQKFTKVKLLSTWGWFVQVNSAVGSNGIGCFQAVPNLEVCANANEYAVTNMLCTHFQIRTSVSIYTNTNSVENSISVHRNASGATVIRLRNTNCTTLEEFKTFLDENEVYVYYALATPIITDLTAEEIAEIEKLHTFYPVTNISNDADCGMGIQYIVDTKNYIDGKTNDLSQAQEWTQEQVWTQAHEQEQLQAEHEALSTHIATVEQVLTGRIDTVEQSLKGSADNLLTTPYACGTGVMYEANGHKFSVGDAGELIAESTAPSNSMWHKFILKQGITLSAGTYTLCCDLITGVLSSDLNNNVCHLDVYTATDVAGMTYANLLTRSVEDRVCTFTLAEDTVVSIRYETPAKAKNVVMPYLIKGVPSDLPTAVFAKGLKNQVLNSVYTYNTTIEPNATKTTSVNVYIPEGYTFIAYELCTNSPYVVCAGTHDITTSSKTTKLSTLNVALLNIGSTSITATVTIRRQFVRSEYVNPLTLL